MINTFSIVPSTKVSDAEMEPINTTLAFHRLIENADSTFLIDNESLFNTYQNQFKVISPTYAAMNDLAAKSIGAATCTLRFPSMLKVNSTLRQMAQNMCPFPRLHFLMNSMTPITAIGAV
jgi:hypothetical protein